jgi:hypothetical protein
MLDGYLMFYKLKTNLLIILVEFDEFDDEFDLLFDLKSAFDVDIFCMIKDTYFFWIILFFVFHHHFKDNYGVK